MLFGFLLLFFQATIRLWNAREVRRAEVSHGEERRRFDQLARERRAGELKMTRLHQNLCFNNFTRDVYERLNHGKTD